ncbi:ABC transporter ATP-binding protein [Terrisporobacter sp.]
MLKNRPILEIKNITKKFNTSDNKVLTACNDVSLEFEEGKILGIVGESGCGKSTLMKMIIQLEDPTSGEILYEGEDITKLKGEKLRQNRRHIQMVFQDPSTAFNPRMKVKDIICEPLLNFKLIKKKQRDEVAKKYLNMVDLPESFADRYIHNMSGGQRQRIGIARALSLDPKVVILDESTSALDVSIQKNIIELIKKLQKEKNITIGFVCHDISLMSEISDKVAVMYLGNLVEVVPGRQLKNGCKHPYTQALISSVFHLNMDFSKEIENIKDEAPSPIDMPKGCPFENRCKYSMEVCKKEKPKLKLISKDHHVACHLNKER